MSKKVRRPKTVIPTQRSYDLDSILGQRGGEGGFGQRDELDDAMRQARKFQAEKLRETMVKKTTLEMEKEVRDLERGIDTGGGGGGSSITASDVQMLSTLPEDQKAMGIQALAAFKGQSGGGGAAGSLGPMLVMSMLQSKPQTSVGEMVIALKGLNDIVSTGKSPTNDISTIVSITKMLLDAKKDDQTSVTEVYRQLLQERNVDPIQQTESVVNLAKTLGMSPAGGQNPEIERMKTQSAESMQQRQHDHELMLRKMEREDSRMETLVNMLADVLKPFAANAGAALPGLLGGVVGGAAGAKLAQPQPQPGGPLSVKCPNPSCGYEPIWVSEDTPVGICPQCGQSVTHPKFKDRVGAQPPSGGAPPPGPGSSMPPPPG